MEQTISPARKITGELLVPGELQPAAQALILASLAEGESRIGNVPPAVDRLVAVLAELGVRIIREKRLLTVQGVGRHGFRPAGGPLDLAGLGDASLLLLGLLAGQTFATRVALDGADQRLPQLLEMLRAMDASVGQETGKMFVVGGTGELAGAAHEAVDVDPGIKLSVLVAGLCAAGATSLPESAGNRNRVERFLRQRQVVVERRRQDDDQYLVSIEGGQTVQPGDVEIPGDLRLAYPLMVPALAKKGSELKILRVAVRSGERGLLDLVRQIGGEVAIQELDSETADLTISFSKQLKATRVAGQRAEKVVEQIPLLTALATQTEGEFVIRDIDALRQGPFDRVTHLFELLKKIGARVGEYPEGLVIKGGTPLQGARIDSRGDPGLAAAFAVAGLLAESEMVIDGAEGLDPVYPDFFAALHAIKGTARK